jgi:hypothetical protein
MASGRLHILRRMRSPLKPLLAAVVTLVALGGPLTPALADVDPASDVLLLQNVFVPYQPEVCEQLKDQLKSLTDKTRQAGYPLKVAIIGSRQDLGGAPQFFGNPQGYAKFLGQELAVYGHDVARDLSNVPLLVVMPQGFGTYQIRREAAAAAKTVPIPKGADSNELAKAAALAIPKVATAAGHPVAAEKAATGCEKKGTSFVVFLVPILVLLLGGFLIRYGLRPGKRAQPGAEASAGDIESP